MKINDKIISIPPYISTTWDQVHSLFVDKEGLMILLKSDLKIRVPLEDKGMLNQIFEAHRKFLENQTSSNLSKTKKQKNLPQDAFSFGFPLKPGRMEDLESFGQAMQHNPNLADSPDIPKDILDKIAKVSTALGLSDQENLPQAEPHCNCVHCQVARAINGQIPEEKTENYEEEVSDEDLKFRDWDIKQKSEYVYLVSNPLDIKEKYNVYLGNPIGCTCGQKNCEHIRSVLNS